MVTFGSIDLKKGAYVKKNINDYERVARVIGGTFLSSLAFWGPKKPMFLGFIFPIITGIVGVCPLYSALGISTRKEVKDSSNDYFPVKSPSEIAAGHPLVGAA